jgi:hypothetical protein
VKEVSGPPVDRAQNGQDAAVARPPEVEAAQADPAAAVRGAMFASLTIYEPLFRTWREIGISVHDGPAIWTPETPWDPVPEPTDGEREAANEATKATIEALRKSADAGFPVNTAADQPRHWPYLRDEVYLQKIGSVSPLAQKLDQMRETGDEELPPAVAELAATAETLAFELIQPGLEIERRAEVYGYLRGLLDSVRAAGEGTALATHIAGKEAEGPLKHCSEVLFALAARERDKLPPVERPLPPRLSIHWPTMDTDAPALLSATGVPEVSSTGRITAAVAMRQAESILADTGNPVPEGDGAG